MMATLRFLSSLRSALTLVLLFTLLLGGVYPLLTTALAQLLFPRQAGGTLIEYGGRTAGSELLGQSFTEAKYVWGRLSATTPPYNAAASAGSNFSPANPKLLEAANARIAALQKSDPKNRRPIPVDLVTASASGLDPHISLESALYQAARVARARGLKEAVVRELISRHAEIPLLGLGQPYVNVLKVNLELDGHEW